MDEVRASLCELVVHAPRTRQLARAALGRLLERKQRHHVARVSVEDLLVRRVCRTTDGTAVARPAEVLDVREHYVSWPALELAVLTAALRRHVRREPCIDGDVFLTRVLVYGHASNDKEAVAVVQLVGEPPELSVEGRQGESRSRDVAKREIQSCK